MLATLISSRLTLLVLASASRDRKRHLMKPEEYTQALQVARPARIGVNCSESNRRTTQNVAPRTQAYKGSLPFGANVLNTRTRLHDVLFEPRSAPAAPATVLGPENTPTSGSPTRRRTTPSRAAGRRRAIPDAFNISLSQQPALTRLDNNEGGLITSALRTTVETRREHGCGWNGGGHRQRARYC